MDVQKRIRQLMNERKWTEYRLSKAAGLSQTTIANLFRRNNAPSLATLEAICTAFGITLSQFFSDGNAHVELTEEQQLLLSRFNTLSAAQKKALSDLVAAMAEY